MVGYLCTPVFKWKVYRKFRLKHVFLRKVFLCSIRHISKRTEAILFKEATNSINREKQPSFSNVILHTLLSFTHSHVNTQYLKK